MTDFFTAMLSELEKQSEIGSVLYLSVQAPDPALLLSVSAQHIAVATPGELLPKSVLKTLKQDARVSVHHVMAGKKKGQAPLSIFNFRAISSTRTPTLSLLALFPNLKEERQIEVDVLPLDELISTLPAQSTSEDVLVIDMPGDVGDVFATLQESGSDQRFGHILLKAGKDQLYEGTPSFAVLRSKLETAGYRSFQCNFDDPDFPSAHFRLEPLALKITELEAELAQMKSAQEELQITLKQKDNALEEAAENQKSLKTERDAERQAHLATQAQLSEQKQALEAELAQMKSAQEELRAELGESETRLKDRAIKLAEIQAHAADLERKLAQTSHRQRAIEDQVTSAEAQIDVLRDLLKMHPRGSEARRG